MKQEQDTYEKPRKYRNRKSRRRGENENHDHPVHRPYAREHKNWTRAVDGLGEDWIEDLCDHGNEEPSE